MADNKLSVVIITKNEETRIKQCIESVAGWADEVVVVDDESTDRTSAFARDLGAKVFVRKIDIEGRHRNWAYSKTENPWVFSVDADERPTEELKQETLYFKSITLQSATSGTFRWRWKKSMRATLWTFKLCASVLVSSDRSSSDTPRD